MREALKHGWKRLFYAGLDIATLAESTADWPRH